MSNLDIGDMYFVYYGGKDIGVIKVASDGLPPFKSRDEAASEVPFEIRQHNSPHWSGSLSSYHFSAIDAVKEVIAFHWELRQSPMEGAKYEDSKCVLIALGKGKVNISEKPHRDPEMRKREMLRHQLFELHKNDISAN